MSQVASLAPELTGRVEPEAAGAAGDIPLERSVIENVEDQVNSDSDDLNSGADTALLADPSDYLVAADGTIEIQATETLGHYADWLGVKTQRLRDLNGYSFSRPVVIGQRLQFQFGRIDAEAFAALRITYHRELQETFFARYRIVDTTVHNLRSGESLYVLSLRRYKVPVWLLRQYNPDLDINRLRPGTPITFPNIQRVTPAGGVTAALTADNANSDSPGATEQ